MDCQKTIMYKLATLGTNTVQLYRAEIAQGPRFLKSRTGEFTGSGLENPRQLCNYSNGLVVCP